MTSKMYAEASRRFLSVAVVGLVAIGLLAAPGCQDYKWRRDHQKAEQEAREQDKYLCVFYKWWLSDASNQMHGNVLPDPAVGALFQDTINLLLEKDSSPEYANYMARYGVTSPPAFVLVAPDGTYYVASGFLPKERFIEFVKNAKAGRSTGSRRPAPAPPPPEPIAPIYFRTLSCGLSGIFHRPPAYGRTPTRPSAGPFTDSGLYCIRFNPAKPTLVRGFDMQRDIQRKRTKFETVEPLGKRVLIRKDEDKKATKGGIALPDSIEIPTITGRVVAVSAQVAADENFPIRQYDKVLFHPKQSVPVDFEPGNQLYVVPIEDVVAVFRFRS